MSFRTAVENPGTRPPRSWVFDIACALLAALASLFTFSFAPAAHPAHPALAGSLAIAVVTALVLSLRRVWPGPVFGVIVVLAAVVAQWPVRGELFPVALAIALYTVAATMSRATALAAAALAVAAEIPAAGQGGWHNAWLPVIYEVIGVASVLIAGLYASTRRAYLAELSDRAQRLEREHDQTSALAAAVERARIAREMHDSVAHHLTVIVALSDGALAAVTRSPARPARRSAACRTPPARRSPRPAACSASCGPRTAWNSGSRCPACPTSRVCLPGSGRPDCQSGTNAAVLPATRPPAFSWSSSGSSRKP
jgi:signal transduction histidine kinase